MDIKIQGQGVQEKLCFFTIHCIPSLAVREVANFREFLENTKTKKTQYLMNTLYVKIEITLGSSSTIIHTLTKIRSTSQIRHVFDLFTQLEDGKWLKCSLEWFVPCHNVPEQL